MTVFRSPNEMLAAAKELMLDNREPETVEDWVKVIAFFAANIEKSVRLVSCLLICDIYNMPLSGRQVKMIIDLQD